MSANIGALVVTFNDLASVGFNRLADWGCRMGAIVAGVTLLDLDCDRGRLPWHDT